MPSPGCVVLLMHLTFETQEKRNTVDWLCRKYSTWSAVIQRAILARKREITPY